MRKKRQGQDTDEECNSKSQILVFHFNNFPFTSNFNIFQNREEL